MSADFVTKNIGLGTLELIHLFDKDNKESNTKYIIIIISRSIISIG